MGYRGYGAYRGDMAMDDYASGSEDVGLDLSSYPDVTPDEFADVTGGSSTVDLPGMLGAGLTGSSIMKFLGSGGGLSQLSNFLGSGAAAGAASVAVPTAKAIARLMGKRGAISVRGRGGTHTATRRVSSWEVRDTRRMNVFNRKAAMRALRRISGLEHGMRHIVHFTHPRPSARVKFHFRRRRRKR